jgi:hypothetical protein
MRSSARRNSREEQERYHLFAKKEERQDTSEEQRAKSPNHIAAEQTPNRTVSTWVGRQDQKRKNPGNYNSDTEVFINLKRKKCSTKREKERRRKKH